MLKDFDRRPRQFFPRGEVATREQFLSYLYDTSDAERDIHFRSISYFITNDIYDGPLPETVLFLEDVQEISEYLGAPIPTLNSIPDTQEYLTQEEYECACHVFGEDISLFQSLGRIPK